jgi:hypothetical protein
MLEPTYRPPDLTSEGPAKVDHTVAKGTMEGTNPPITDNTRTSTLTHTPR